VFVLFTKTFLSKLQRNFQKKQDEFQAQCDSGDVRGCHSLAEFFHLFLNDQQGALSRFLLNCDPPPGAKCPRYAPSCFSAASLMMQRKENERVAELFEKACVSGSIEGCANLGIIYQRGLVGVTPNPQKGMEYSEKVKGKNVFE
jgi:hypothetical protein